MAYFLKFYASFYALKAADAAALSDAVSGILKKEKFALLMSKTTWYSRKKGNPSKLLVILADVPTCNV